ncbi:MAG: SDR family oxidoreductase [Prevotellaceae bacterium]|jgi:short-subunit dehydrogenase|nr:SDR family oxidoreductase [Prevotellaceae bacterium]
MQKTVLITGASAGIGLALYGMLHNAGYKVYAASRSGSFPMDINDDASVNVAAEKIVAESTTLDILVCSAGNGIAGAVEDMTLDEVRYQMETNFFGTVRTIQSFLPVFRRQGYGKIIVISSVAGLVPIPFQSVYSASKAAITIFCDALALELKPYNIQVCSVLPGDTKTNFTAARRIAANAQSPSSAYKIRFEKSIGKMERDEQSGMSPEEVAKTVLRQIRRKRMCLHAVPGTCYKLICGAFRFLPARLKMWIVGLMYG